MGFLCCPHVDVWASCAKQGKTIKMADGEESSKVISSSNTSQNIPQNSDNQAEQLEDILSKDFIPLCAGDSSDESVKYLGTNSKETTQKTLDEEMNTCMPGPSGVQNDNDGNHGDDGDEDEGNDDDGDDDKDDDDNGDGDDDGNDDGDDDALEKDDEHLLDESQSYTQRKNEFTSEIFKIVIVNLPRFATFKGIRSRIQSLLDFKPVKIKTVPYSGVGFVTFRNEEQRQKALIALDRHKWKGSRLVVKIADALPDPVVAKKLKFKKKKKGNNSQQKQLQSLAVTLRQSQKVEAVALARKRFLEQEEAGDEDNSEAKKTKLDPLSELNFSVTPMWNLPYPEQIELKFKFTVETLKKLTTKLNRITYDQDSLLPTKDTSKAKQEICCTLLPCIPSPVINGYRNKCEFTIAAGPNGEKTVGFRLGSYKDGFSGVAEPTQCIHISDTAKKVASVFQKYIRQSTSMDVFDLCEHTGHWQTLTVRTTDFGETMAVIQFNKQKLTKFELDNVMKDVKTFFTEREGKECNITSLYFQPSAPRITGQRPVEFPLELLYGTPCIHEVINGVKFRISPDAFFQVNVKAAVKMFDIMLEWMGDCSKATLLDICCGTGTIGLCLAKYVSKVIGLELVESAVKDAEMNAEMNGIKNATYITGRAEDKLHAKVIAHLPAWETVIGIADPPRAGLHKKVIKAIRGCKRMDKLIYVSCNANGAFENFIDLCRPMSKRIKSLPFRLVKAIPIDFFPHTQHCELLMLFERDKSFEETFQYYKFFY